MKLYVVRHAQAEPNAGGISDEARQLTDRGKERMTQAARGMRRLGLEFDAILTSPLARAAQTADIISEAYDHEPAPQILAALATGVAPAQAVAALAPYAKSEQVMIVGHEPQLSAIVSILLTGASDRVTLEFTKGGCVALELSEKPERGASELLWMLTQSQLRKLRKKPS
jgi:phosphohistidine phosphatase